VISNDDPRIRVVCRVYLVTAGDRVQT